MPTNLQDATCDLQGGICHAILLLALYNNSIPYEEREG